MNRNEYHRKLATRAASQSPLVTLRGKSAIVKERYDREGEGEKEEKGKKEKKRRRALNFQTSEPPIASLRSIDVEESRTHRGWGWKRNAPGADKSFVQSS